MTNSNFEVSPRGSGAAENPDEFRLLIDSIQDYAILILNEDGTVRTWNNGARRINGYEREEIVGQHFSKFYLPEDIARGKPALDLKAATEAGRYEDEGWRVRKNGTRFWASCVISPIIDSSGAQRGFGKVTRDLTEPRKAEERYRMLVESVKDYGIFMLDANGIVRSWNVGAELIKGYRADEIIGRHFSTFYTPEDIAREHPADELRRAAATGKFEEEGWRVRKDGKRFWANVVITALRGDNGELLGFSKVTRDLTERKNAEETLRKAFAELESFSYSVSHDLRAPLRSMDGFSEILLSTAADKLDDRSKGYLTRIRESSQKMARLIDDLLELSQLSRMSLSRQKLNLSDMAEKISAELARNEPTRQVDFRINPDVISWGDPTLVQVVLENLLGNAWKYTSNVPRAAIEFGIEKGSARYFVKDNGAGFDMRYKQKLFGAFQRLHAATEFPGSGIGLATVQRIVHRHGGEVDAAGEPGKGATFFFTLDA